MWAGAGSRGVNFDTVAEKVPVPAATSPIVAGVAALLAYRLTDRAREASVTKRFRIGQIASASLVSLAHGTNGAQKTMGVITLTLISAGALGHHAGPPLWGIASAGLAIGLEHRPRRHRRRPGGRFGRPDRGHGNARRSRWRRGPWR